MTTTILWMAHGPSDAAASGAGLRPTGSGSWTYELARLLAATGRWELVIACHTSVARRIERVDGGVREVLLPANPSDRSRPDAALRADCQELVRQYRPALIHLHGVEKTYALALDRGGVPVIATIHGLLHLMKRGWWGGLTAREVLAVQGWQPTVRGQGIVPDYLRLRRRGQLEQAVIGRVAHLIGATAWDEAHVRAVAPHVPYIRIPPAIRREFFETQWEPWSAAEQLVSPAALYPAKGAAVLLKAFRLLRDRFPRLRLILAGHPLSSEDSYHWFLRRLIDRLDLANAVDFAGFQTSKGLADLYARSAVAVFPSLVENWSTSLVEAMVVGTPTVAAFTGGLSSVSQDQFSTVFVPPADPELLALQVGRLLGDPGTAARLGNAARQVARRRHDPDALVQATSEVYEHWIAGARPRTSP